MSLRKLYKITITVAILLSIPLIAMQFTNQVVWTLSDFVIASLLLFSLAIVGDYILRKLADYKYRFIVYFALILSFLLLWVELSVGIFNSPISGS